MLHHVEIYVSDLERSIAFWSPFMRQLGYEADRWSEGMNYTKEGQVARTRGRIGSVGERRRLHDTL